MIKCKLRIGRGTICCNVHVQTLRLIYWQIIFNPTFIITFNIFFDNNKLTYNFISYRGNVGYITINNIISFVSLMRILS